MRPRDLAALLGRAGPYAARYLCQSRRQPATPMALSFLVTARCPLECQHCFFHYAVRQAKDELSIDEYRQLAASLDNFGVALFCGGEPFVRDDLAEIVSLFRQQNGVLLSFASTNGQLTEPIVKQTEQILRRHPRRPFILSFSIDGFQEEHDRIRGPGTFDHALRSWRECQRLARHHGNLQLAMSTVLCSLNHQRAHEFIRWAMSELEPESLGVLLVRQNPRGGPELKRVDPHSYRQAQQAALGPLRNTRLSWLARPQVFYFATIAHGVYRTMTTGARSFHCHAGRHGGVIDHLGRLSPCEVLAEQPDVEAIGKLRDVGMNFKALWANADADRIRQWVGRHEVCANCTHETMGYLPSVFFSPNRLRFYPRVPIP